jgi:hypothetical protein
LADFIKQTGLTNRAAAKFWERSGQDYDAAFEAWNADPLYNKPSTGGKKDFAEFQNQTGLTENAATKFWDKYGAYDAALEQRKANPSQFNNQALMERKVL